jgi:hypothetical protein
MVWVELDRLGLAETDAARSLDIERPGLSADVTDRLEPDTPPY